MNERKRLLIMAPLLLIAAWFAFFGDKTPPAEQVAAPTAQGTVRAAAPVPQAGSAPVAGATAPAANLPAPGRAGVQQALQDPDLKNLFGSNAPPPPPPQPTVQENLPPPGPSFTFIGRMFRDGKWNVFFDKQDQTYVATIGTVIDGYRVEAVQSDRVQLTQLSDKSTHIIPIEGDK